MKENWKILAVEGKSLIAFFIRRAQRRLGYSEEESRITHVGLLNVQTGYVYEALHSGVKKTPIQNYVNERCKVHFLDLKNYPYDIENRAEKFMNHEDNIREYDYSLLFGLLLFSLGFSRKILDFFNKTIPHICTEYLSEVLDVNIYFPAEFYRSYTNS